MGQKRGFNMDDNRPVKITISLDLQNYIKFKLLAEQIGIKSNDLGYIAIIHLLSALKENGYY